MNKFRAALDVIASVAIVVVCGAVTWSTVRTPHMPTAPKTGSRPQANNTIPLDPVSLRGASIQGDQHAKVAVLIYSDFQCPYCRAFAQDTLPGIEQKYVRTGKVLVGFRHFPLESIHASALPAAEAAVCAAEQGKFWEMHDHLFATQGSLGATSLADSAAALNLDDHRFRACLDKPDVSRVRSDEDQGKKLGVSGTPTIFIGTLLPDNSVKVSKRLTGATPFAQMDVLLDSLVKQVTTTKGN